MIRKHICVLALALLGAVAAYPQVNLNATPSRSVGHPNTPQLEQATLYSVNPNLVEGRELYQPQGVAVDMTVTPHPIFVSDSANNRVLGWRDVTTFKTGQMADIVIGQIDFLTTWPQGPNAAPHAPNQGQPLQSGLSNPTGIAALNGDLYVADSGNNRVLRYPKPFTNTDHRPDLVIGQSSLGASTANSGGQVSEKTLFLASGNAIYQANIAFDQAGNLWLTDPGNRRVLEYAAADVARGGAGLSAILVIGQDTFTTTRTNLNPNTASSNLIANQFAVPSAIAFDPKGRLFVADADPNQPQNFSRVLVFTPPFQSAMSASRIAGVLLSGTTAPTQFQVYSTVMADPEGLFFLADGSMGVVDSLYNRVLIFPPFDNWPSQLFQGSPQATAVVGHSDFTSLLPNNAQAGATYVPPPSGSVFRQPLGASFTGSELYIADQGNNRVLAMPLQGSTFGAATRVLGQDLMDTGSINLVEGREFQFVTSDSAGVHVDAGVAIDSTGDQPHLYVADTGNNRVLGFRDMRSLAAGAKADIVIGQQNLTRFQTALCNYPAGDPGAPQPWSLCSPTGVLVDSSGNLWVADRGNARVLRFPKPFTQSGQIQADLVLGQQDFTSKFTDATQSNMGAPYGLAMAYDANGRANGKLLVSDQNHNRVLIFTPSGGAFQNGQAASGVVGQSDFRSTAAGSDNTALNSPHHISVDTDGRVYIADSGNRRVQIFNDVVGPGSVVHPSAALSIPVSGSPEGVYVSPTTGEIWATDTTNGKALRFPQYGDLFFQGTASNFTLSVPSYTLALALDQFGALAVADASNRVAFYYPRLAAQNAANFVSTDTRALAPGTWTTLYPYVGQFSATTENFTGYPLPPVLADTQVLLNGAPAGLTLVSPGQINLYVPMNVHGDFLDVQVIRKSTGRVLGAAQIAMASVAPALFLNPTGQVGTSRTLAAINFDDLTVNGPNNPVKRGSWVLLYGTGQGVIAGSPTDGSPAPASPLYSTTGNLRVVVGACYLDDQGCTKETGNVYFSGLAPGFVGLWQINVRIPQNTPPGATVTLVTLESVPSAGSLSSVGYNTVVYVQ
jgi:uncharacterized protein (TIGR03437 family)